MNKSQAGALKHKTCYLIEIIEPILLDMAQNGLPQKDVDKIDKALDDLYKMNKKYVKLSK